LRWGALPISLEIVSAPYVLLDRECSPSLAR
jgi:hypothetical protein